jgi:hypothetical protein
METKDTKERIYKRHGQDKVEAKIFRFFLVLIERIFVVFVFYLFAYFFAFSA